MLNPPAEETDESLTRKAQTLQAVKTQQTKVYSEIAAIAKSLSGSPSPA
jgi:hypothetical protein